MQKREVDTMAQIQVLDSHTAELIAAGEVVERPSSVVKELCENAIDAGAAHISVTIRRGGVELIEVSDDGTGIEAESVPTAFLRHATSKIRTQEDLEAIHTLGFRGEALASIASVAHVELLTKTKDDEFACLYRISGGAEQGFEAGARGVGTTITVKNLFYNTPARMKFLKKDTSEGNYVSDVVSELALAHPEVAFRFVREGRVQFQTPGDGQLLGAAYAVLGREFSKDLLEVDGGAGPYRAAGLITPPRACRASRAMQFFFVNGRFVKNRTMMAALEAAYKGTLMQGKFPGCVLSLSMPAQLVDVNVHPAKTEVRFAREKDAFDAVYSAVKSALMQKDASHQMFAFGSGEEGDAVGQEAYAWPQPEGNVSPQPSAHRPAPVVPVAARQSAFRGEAPAHGGVRAYGEMLSSLASAPPVPYGRRQVEMPAVRQHSIDIMPEDAQPVQAAHEAPVSSALPEESAPEQTALPGAQQTGEPLRVVGEVFRTYIVAERGSTLCLIDKHAAHERAIYEKLVAGLDETTPGQMLLAPVTVRLSAEEKEVLLQNAELLGRSGLEVEDFGGTSVVVRTIPADVEAENAEDLVVELAGGLAADPRQARSEKAQWVMHSISCRAAMKAGDKTPVQQLVQLAQDVLDGKIPPFCPHGRPVVLEVPQKELEKQFGRQG
ncbi:MAG: DNA mismatch repair endonuclease MutL [Ruthenibacterium sp.]|jgi:DNA mismatch repair protein MutL